MFDYTLAASLRGMHMAFGGLDRARRRRGQLFDLVGAGPKLTPCDTYEPAPGVRLRAFSPPSASGPVVLLIPSPIKRWYLWDLQPDRSVVARCVGAGARVFLAEWTDPGPVDQDRGLDAYADSLLTACLDLIAEQTGADRALLAGHSLGGTLAAILAARRPERAAGLVLLEAPLHFGGDAGAFAPLVAAAPPAGLLRAPGHGIAGSLLNAATATAAPVEFQVERHLDLTRSLARPGALATHLRVQRWTLDEFTMPGQLFEDIIERLYRRDELHAGTLSISGAQVGPKNVHAPMVNVVNPRSRAIPPRSILPFHEAAASPEKELLYYHGDVGVALQHAGVLVGEEAHQHLWPQLLAWMHATWDD